MVVLSADCLTPNVFGVRFDFFSGEPLPV